LSISSAESLSVFIYRSPILTSKEFLINYNSSFSFPTLCIPKAYSFAFSSNLVT
jgi:hypothetical protein